MKRFSCFVLVVSIIFSGITALAAEEAELVSGEDKVERPIASEGLLVHSLFQSNMVLQRDKPIPVWGTAKPGEKVTVTFDGKEESAVAAKDKSWKVTFPAMEASTKPREMTVKGKDATFTFDNILIGDVWVFAGQSNMEFGLHRLNDGDLEIASANFENIRLLRPTRQQGPDNKTNFPVMYQWSDRSKNHSRKGYWEVCTPETVGNFSAIGYIFARRLYMATGVPIGAIDTSIGGTTLEAWTPLSVLQSIKTPMVAAMLKKWDTDAKEYDPKADLAKQVQKHKDRVEQAKKEGKTYKASVPTEAKPGPIMSNRYPGNCYASIISPLTGLPVKGTLWHQGYNNAFQPNAHVMYYQIFPKMIAAWRNTFDDPEMPFGIISLCTAGEPQDLNNYLQRTNDEGVMIRAVQYQTFADLFKAGDTNVGFASSFDHRHPSYHPRIKVPVGERIARWALAMEYGMNNISWKPPMLDKMVVEDGRILLHLTESVNAPNNEAIVGFAIAGEDGKFQPAKAKHYVAGKDDRGRPKLDTKVLELTSPLVPKPVHFRYAWSRNPLANLKGAGIPFATQRSDRSTRPEIYEQYTGEKVEIPGEVSRGENHKLNAALRDEDLRRRKAEAEEFLRSLEK